MITNHTTMRTGHMATNTTESALALFAWLSPSYPVGAFAYSHGLEWAIETGDVRDAQTLACWLESILEFGSGRNDAIIFVAAFRALNAGAGIGEIAELACALASSSERRLESTQQGAAFLAATCAAWPDAALVEAVRDIDTNTAYPVCFAAAAAAHGMTLRPALDGYLAAFASNLVSGAVRLSVIGQTAGQGVVARMAPLAARVAAMAEHATLEDLGGCAFRADLASFHHETQYARLFRS